MKIKISLKKTTFIELKEIELANKQLSPGRMEKLQNQKLSTTEHLDQKKMVYFVQEYLDLSKITNAYVVSIKE